MPRCSIGEDEALEVVEEIRLLGVMVTSDLKWNAHCDYICQKAFARMWMLRRLKPLGATTEDLLQIYITQIRSILEFAVPAWNSGLTKALINQLERVQKCALAIILDKDYITYSNAIKKLQIKTLAERRRELCMSFALQSQKSDKYSNWFCENESLGLTTRSEKPAFKPVQARLRGLRNRHSST